jgi:hypothetical protein
MAMTAFLTKAILLVSRCFCGCAQRLTSSTLKELLLMYVAVLRKAVETAHANAITVSLRAIGYILSRQSATAPPILSSAAAASLYDLLSTLSALESGTRPPHTNESLFHFYRRLIFGRPRISLLAAFAPVATSPTGLALSLCGSQQQLSLCLLIPHSLSWV